MDQRKLMDNANTITDMAKVSWEGIESLVKGKFVMEINESK
jgi:hypothetical protein